MMQSSEPCHLIGGDKKSEIVQYFQGRLWDKIQYSSEISDQLPRKTHPCFLRL